MNTSNTFDENPKLKHKSSNTFTGIIHRTMLKLIGFLPFISSTYRNHHENNLKNALLSQAARVAHDIISPIATIEMSLYTLSQEVPQDKLVIIKAALQNVRDITNSLLEKYRNIQHPDQPSSASQDQMSIQPIILLHPVIKEVISQKHCEWLDKKYKLEFDFQAETQTAQIHASPQEIKRILSNLLNNALEASQDQADIKVTMKLAYGLLQLTISDNGIGIKPDEVNTYLLGKSTKHSGLGIGLSSAKEYMKKIGGELSIASNQNQGTSITLTFKIK